MRIDRALRIVAPGIIASFALSLLLIAVAACEGTTTVETVVVEREVMVEKVVTVEVIKEVVVEKEVPVEIIKEVQVEVPVTVVVEKEVQGAAETIETTKEIVVIPTQPPSPTPVTDKVQNVTKAITTGNSFTCALRENGKAECWGYNESGQSSPELGRFTAISAGEYHACGLRENGQVVCWGQKRLRSVKPAGTRLYCDQCWLELHLRLARKRRSAMLGQQQRQ